MYLDKVKPFWKEEELQRVAEIENEQQTLLTARTVNAEGELPEVNWQKWEELEEESRNIFLTVEERYIKARTEKQLLEDAKEIIEDVEKEEFLEYINAWRQTLEIATERGADTAQAESFKKYTLETYDNCFGFMLHPLRVQLNAFADNDEATNKLFEIVGKKVSLWYQRPEWEQDTWKMVHNRATDELSYMSTKGAIIDPIAKAITIERGGISLTLKTEEKDIPIEKLNELTAKLGTGTIKLLNTALAVFTQNNDFRSKKALDLNIIIPLRDYARALGADIDEHETSTPEEAEKEKNRAKNALKNARKAIAKHMDTLYKASLSWKDEPDFDDVRIITRKSIKNGYIRLELYPGLAKTLAEKRTITEFPLVLLSYDERNPNAYKIGLALAQHFAIDNNYIKGTTNRLKVKTLLSNTSLPTYKEVQEKDRGHWVERIKAPFENALDYNIGRVLISENYKGAEPWKYTKEKGLALTEEELEKMQTDFDFWSSLYITYEMKYTLDRAERIEERIKAKKAKEANEKRRKKKS